MPRGVAASGSGTRRQDGVPVGMRRHSWVAALTVRISDEEVGTYKAKAETNTSYGKPWAGKVNLDRPADVLDCYCERCGVRAGSREEYCPRHPMAAYGLPR